MIINECSQIIREYFDMSDNYTRRYIANLNESGQEQLIAALSSALYDKIVAKVDDIDFGTIPQSRGDITKVQGFANTEQCVDIIRKLVIQYNQKTDIVDAIITSISNIKERKNLFTKAFAVKAEMPIMIYNLMVLAIERSVSLIIATCIQFVKDPQSSTVKTALDKVAYEKSMDDILYKQLVTFNSLCKTGTMDQTLNTTMKNNSVHEEVDVVGSVLGRESDGEIGDGSTAPAEVPADARNVDPFGGDNTPGEPASTVAKPEANFDVFNPANKPQLDEPEVPAPVAVPNPVQQPPMIAQAIKDLLPSEPEEGCCGAANDGVQPENIPTVTSTDGVDDAVMDEPITEKELQEAGLLGALAGYATKVASDKIRNTSADGKGNIMTAIDAVKKGKYKKLFVTGAVVAGLVALPFAIVKVIIPFIRNCVYYFHYTKLKVSDYLEIQAELIEANANDLINSTDSDLTEEQKAKVAERQRKWADRLRRWANVFAIDHKQAVNNAKKEAEKDSKEKKKVGKDEDGDDSIF